MHFTVLPSPIAPVTMILVITVTVTSEVLDFNEVSDVSLEEAMAFLQNKICELYPESPQIHICFSGSDGRHESAQSRPS
jgi:hypothetical protein